MTYQLVQKENETTYIIDGLAFGMPKRTSTFILDEDKLTLINIGATPAIKHIKTSLKQLNNLLSRVKYIIITNTELTSLGGVGVLLNACPNAQIIARESFIDTLTTPKTLISETRAIYGDYFSDNFEPIKPVESALIKTVEDNELINISDETQLKFILPKNKEHMMILNTKSNNLFVGHSIGVYYDQLIDDDLNLFIPSIPARGFSAESYQASLDMIKKIHPTTLSFNHFGTTNKVDLALNQLSYWFELFILIAEETTNYNELSSKLLQAVHTYLRENNIPDNHPIYQYIILDINTCAQAMLRYTNK